LLAHAPRGCFLLLLLPPPPSSAAAFCCCARCPASASASAVCVCVCVWTGKKKKKKKKKRKKRKKTGSTFFFLLDCSSFLTALPSFLPFLIYIYIITFYYIYMDTRSLPQ
jgi:hypothetical protein